MSKAWCPCCGRKAKKAKAVKGIGAYVEYTKKKDALTTKALQLVRLLGGKYISAAPILADRGGGGEAAVQPVEGTLEAKQARRLANKRASNRRWLERHPGYSKDYYQRQKALRQRRELPEDPAEAEDELGDSALDYAERKNEKLARDREYQRKYYSKNKERIDRLRRERAARRRSPTTGARANGH